MIWGAKRSTAMGRNKATCSGLCNCVVVTGSLSGSCSAGAFAALISLLPTLPTPSCYSLPCFVFCAPSPCCTLFSDVCHCSLLLLFDCNHAASCSLSSLLTSSLPLLSLLSIFLSLIPCCYYFLQFELGAELGEEE